MNKKDGGLLRNWQLHTMATGEEAAEKKTMLMEGGHDIKTDNLYIMTATVVEDPTDRFGEGSHIRSSVVVNIDKENGTVETLNTIYRVVDEGGDLFDDLGKDVLKIFY